MCVFCFGGDCLVGGGEGEGSLVFKIETLFLT